MFIIQGVNMLENIKDVLEIIDNSKDKLINRYISKVTQKVLNYCNLKELPIELQGFVEDKVISIMQYKLQSTSSDNSSREVKSIQRGDTKIEFATMSEKDEKTLLNFSNLDMKELNSFRKVAW
ncbi:phage head-tail connector protein [Clostridium sp.]|uniref:phage head-tail connector protein n=1 Tax=Clostridium sp. TaxID=1506 RepID=UPI002FDCB7CA